MTDETLELIQMYAGDILNSDTYKIQKIYPHHRRINVYEHELHVTEIAINLARNGIAGTRISIQELRRRMLKGILE